jgi:hypothetical protein
MGGVGHDLDRAAVLEAFLAGQGELDGGGGDGGARPQGVAGHAVGPELLGHAQHAQAHIVLGHRIGDVRREPAGLDVQRRRQRQDVRVGRLLQVRQADLRGQERAAPVDLVHQVVALHVGRQRARQRDRRGVVHADVDAAERLDRLVDGRLDAGLLAHVDHQRQGLAAGRLDLLGGGVDGARQLGMGLGGLGGDDDIGPVAGRAQGDGQADAARGAGDEEGLAV